NNIHKIFSYGRRNGFGLAFDPATGFLWESENADDSMDEMNLITAGSNGGWTQIMGPVDQLALFKEVETTFTALHGDLRLNGSGRASFIPAMQQVRADVANTADTPEEALSRLFVIPGSHYEDPKFSWLWAVAPAGIGFVQGNGLGAQYNGDLFVGESRTF